MVKMLCRSNVDEIFVIAPLTVGNGIRLKSILEEADLYSFVSPTDVILSLFTVDWTLV